MGKKQNRCGKAERQKRREMHAATWSDGFNYGYNFGYDQGFKDAAILAQRNILKFAHRGH